MGYLRRGHVYVLAGATNNQYPGQFIQAESVILNHENPFSPGNNANDVALIKLTKVWFLTLTLNQLAYRRKQLISLVKLAMPVDGEFIRDKKGILINYNFGQCQF